MSAGARATRLLAAAAAVALLAGACQPAATKPPSPATAPLPPPPPASLRAADDKLFAGDYAGAERDYRGLAAADGAGAAAHYSLLLTYESRFQEALAQAQAGVALRADSPSLARLTRALDWSQDVPSALAAGARAVAAKPVDPLAHIFYAEALADSARFTEAAAELHGAEAQPMDAFATAELDREWANYWRDRKDPQQELNYVELAVKAQPRFPERRLEVARYQYLKKNQDAARATLDRVQETYASSYWILLGAGDAAFYGQDFDRAVTLYQAAAGVDPTGAAAVLGQAEIGVALKRDFSGAHTLLLAALRRTPTGPGAGSIYQYVRYLDLLVLKTDPDQELKPIAPDAGAEIVAARKAAMDRLNGIRAAVGVPAVSEDPGLAEAAQAHSYYFLFNLGQPQLQGLGIHAEDPGLPGYVGTNGLVRARHFGYGGDRGSEVINHVYSPEAALQVWLDSVFHRFPLIDRETTAAGYGEAQMGILSISVFEFGLARPRTGTDAVVYPAAGQRGVPTAFTGNEIPDPVPQGGSYPVGYPITLQVGGGSLLDVASGRLLGPGGQEIPSYTLQPGAAVEPSQWSLLAHDPLQPQTTYSVEVSGKLDGQSWSKRWDFTTAAAS